MNCKRTAKTGIAPASILAVLLAASGCASGSPASGAAPASSQPPAASASPTPTVRAPRTTAPPTMPGPAASDRVVLSRVSYGWAWPNANGSARVTHTYTVPPVPELVRIGVGDHPREAGERPFNRISFTFTTAFPGYRFEFTDRLIADPKGDLVPLAGMGVLEIVFTEAQAHVAGGGGSSIVSQPGRHLGLSRMAEYAQGGDFEGVLSYGVGIVWPIAHSNPQLAVRAYEVEKVTPGGQRLYTIAFDVDATNPVGG
jgi:hypothetical protein